MTTFDPKSLLSVLPHQPGVYQLLNAQGQTLYVGKAKDLKKRIASYFQKTIVDPKTQTLMQYVVDVKVTVTTTERDALVLENTLIKSFWPRYNILLKDDKSYPYLYITIHNEFPRMVLVRERQKGGGKYFGPYPDARTARESLQLMQKIFLLRQCEDSFFKTRARPCLQYQIKRCTAPCVGLIDAPRYREDVKHATLFLEGKNETVMHQLTEKMEAASTAQNYELAAHYRDQTNMLRKMQMLPVVSREAGDVDVIAVVQEHHITCIALLLIREGRLLGNRNFFPKTPANSDAAEAMAAFVGQHYLVGETLAERIPKQIITNVAIIEARVFADALSELAGRHVNLSAGNVRGIRAQWLEMAVTNAKQALKQHAIQQATLRERFAALQEALQLNHMPARIECFDVSHTLGEATVASCVVFGVDGPIKQDYRRFNITDITPGDDYAALKQALLRRYTRLKTSEAVLPDLIMIDGGKGQLHIAQAAIEELQLSDVTLIAIAKGELRKSGLEVIWQAGDTHHDISGILPEGQYLLQLIRDEAHRFALAGHRARRAKTRQTSVLESIPGLGAARRRALLRYFGGLQGIQQAGVEMLAKVPGISHALAERIYKALR